MTGPCLCGDPYCASCGDPSAAAMEGAVDFLAALVLDSTEAGENFGEDSPEEIAETFLRSMTDDPEKWRSLLALACPESSDDAVAMAEQLRSENELAAAYEAQADAGAAVYEVEPDVDVEAPQLVDRSADPEPEAELVDGLRELFGDEDADAAGRLLRKAGLEVKPKGWTPWTK